MLENNFLMYSRCLKNVLSFIFIFRLITSVFHESLYQSLLLLKYINSRLWYDKPFYCHEELCIEYRKCLIDLRVAVSAAAQRYAFLIIWLMRHEDFFWLKRYSLLGMIGSCYFMSHLLSYKLLNLTQRSSEIQH